jgi:propionate CoA-transferase
MLDRIITAQVAAGLIKDGDTVFVGGNGGTGVAEAILCATEARFLDTDRPRDLTLMHVTGVGAVDHGGVNHFAHRGMVKRVIGGNYGLQLPFMKELIVSNEVEAYNFPQGVMSQMCRAMAAKQPGVITHVGLGTYMDPRQEGGKMNAAATEDLIEVVELGGREWLFYRASTPDIAFIRGTTADEDGYVSMEHEGTTREDLSIAQAVHNGGGIVVCQVKRLAPRGALHPLMVRIPGFLIDHFVVDPDQWQTFGTQYDPATTGEVPASLSAIEPDPLDIRRVIARRAAMELRRGEVINVGVGVSMGIPNIAAEEGVEDMVTLTVEAGVIGGIPGALREFGTAQNPRAILDQAYQFDFYDGGGLDAAFLSFAEVDRHGNVNVTRFGERNDGAGGFIDISQNAKRLIFSGTLTGGGLEVALADGGIHIEREGQVRKFVPQVGQISYNAGMGQERGQSVLFVTDRAVLHIEGDGLVLTEITPGARLREDVLDQIGFEVEVSAELKPVDERIFRAGPMGLRELISSDA